MKEKMEEPTLTKMEQARNGLYPVADDYVKETQLHSCILNLLVYNKFTSLKRQWFRKDLLGNIHSRTFLNIFRKQEFITY